MSEQLRFGGDRSRAPVTSTTDCGVAGSLRVELVLIEDPSRPDVEIVRMSEGNRVTTVPIDQLEPLLRALSKAKDSSERRRARRAPR